MAIMTGTERARLLKLGKFVQNHLEKDRVLLAEATHAEDVEQQKFASFLVRNDAQELLILGEILGEDGTAFTTQGKRTDRSLLQAHNITSSGKITTMHVKLWKDRQTVEDSQVEPCAPDEVKDKDSDTRDFLVWGNDLLRVPLTQGRQKCAFCGDPATYYRVLQACGSCKKTLYCDKMCQKMHWRKEHKMVCKKAGGSHKVEETKAVENKAEDSQDLEKVAEMKPEDSRSEKSKAAENNVEERKDGHGSMD